MDKNGVLNPILKWSYQPVRAGRRRAWEWKHAPRKRRLLAEKNGFKGLHFGCGPFRLEGWINVDLDGQSVDFPLDITRPLPIPDTCFDALYGSEVIEHIDLAQARGFLAEAYRILKPRGVIRLTTTDAPEICRIYLGTNPAARVENFRTVWLEGEFSPEIWLNSLFNGYGHKHVYSFESLSRELHDAGFTGIRRCPPQRTDSGLAQLANLEQRYGADPPPFVFACTLIDSA